jgi:hypothetical protein
LNDYVNMQTPISWLCLVPECQFQWEAPPSYLLGGSQSGCPKCGRSLQLTNEEVDARLQGGNIRRIGDYINSKTPMEFACTVSDCLHTWKTSPGRLVRGETGCPKCSIGKNQRIVLDALDSVGIVFEVEKYLADISEIDSLYHVDFYLPQHSVIIEYNGRQHYEPVRFGNMALEKAKAVFSTYQQPRDAFVRAFCDEHDIRLISIDGRTYFNNALSEYMISHIIPILAKINESYSNLDI